MHIEIIIQDDGPLKTRPIWELGHGKCKGEASALVYEPVSHAYQIMFKESSSLSTTGLKYFVNIPTNGWETFPHATLMLSSTLASEAVMNDMPSH